MSYIVNDAYYYESSNKCLMRTVCLKGWSFEPDNKTNDNDDSNQ